MVTKRMHLPVLRVKPLEGAIEVNRVRYEGSEEAKQAVEDHVSKIRSMISRQRKDILESIDDHYDTD